jgi:glutamate formiminotransferase
VIHLRRSATCHCPQVIDQIAAAIRDTEGCTLLDVDAGVSTNRTVYTFVGEPAAVVRGAFNAARTARRLINMAAHRGEGAVFNSILSLLIVSDCCACGCVCVCVCVCVCARAYVCICF